MELGDNDDNLIFQVDEDGFIGKPAGVVVNLKPQDIGARLRQHFEEHIQLFRNAAYNAAMRGVSHAVQLARDEDLVFEGLYRQSFHARRTADGAVMINDAPYAHVIEYGRRPMQPGPPFDPIRKWVAVKLQVPEEELDRVAWLVQRKIHVKGTRPRFIMKRTHEMMRRWYGQLIRSYLANHKVQQAKDAAERARIENEGGFAWAVDTGDGGHFVLSPIYASRRAAFDAPYSERTKIAPMYAGQALNLIRVPGKKK